MRSVAKFLALPAADQWLLLNALAVITLVRLRLALFPFRPGRGSSRPGAAQRKAGPSPQRIAWAIERVSGYLGSATCLPRALAAHAMLRRHGFASRVSIGVMPGEPFRSDSGLVAHAWVEFGGEILVGGPDISRYNPLLTWPN